MDSINVTSIERLFVELVLLFPDCYTKVISSVIVERRSLKS